MPGLSFICSFRPGDADLEELVQVAGNDAQETQPLQQGRGRVLGLGEHAAVEFQDAKFTIDQMVGGGKRAHGGGRNAVTRKRSMDANLNAARPSIVA
jgi:hypothetical protein